MKRFTSLIMCLMILFSNLMAQKLEVKSMTRKDIDLSASVNQRNDLNGRPCGLVKVSATLTNVTFGGSVIGNVTRDGSDYWVYLPEGTKNLQIKHPNFKNIIVAFPSLGIKQIEGKKTYEMDVEVPMTAYEMQPTPRANAVPAVATTSTAPAKTNNTKVKIKDYLSAFFPIGGITLGKTNADDARRMGYEVNDNGFFNGKDLSWRIDKNRHTVTYMVAYEFPEAWITKYGFDKTWSYNQWYNTLKELGFRVDVEKEPVVEEYGGHDVLSAKLRATPPNGQFYFDLQFDYGDDGFSVDSPNTLYWAGFEAKSTINTQMERLLKSTKGKRDHVKPSADVNLLFPVYGITLGKSTWYDMANAGHLVEDSNNSIFCTTLGLQFADHDKKGYFDNVYITTGENMPNDWQKLGFQWGNSYQTWLELLEQFGYTINVNKAPTIGEYQGRNVLQAKVTAISPDGSLHMNLDFNYGYSHTVTGAGTLYSISMTAL